MMGNLLVGRIALIAIVLAILTVPLAPIQSSQSSWIEADRPNNAWQLDLQDGSQELIALPHPPKVFSVGMGAAWGGHIEPGGDFSRWFTLQYAGRTADGVEVVLRQGPANERSRSSFRNTDKGCARPEQAVNKPVCRAQGIMYALLEGGDAFGGPGMRTMLPNAPYTIPLRIADPPTLTQAPALMLRFED